MFRMLSTYVMIAAALTVALDLVSHQAAATTWSFILLLYLVCMTVVPFSMECSDAVKYAYLALKITLFVLVCRVHWKRTRTGVPQAAVSLLIAVLYAVGVDVKAVYGCAPSTAEYVAAVASALCLYACCGLLLQRRTE